MRNPLAEFAPARELDLVRLALDLMKTLDLETLTRCTLDALGEVSPGGSWALYLRLGPRRYQVTTRGPVDAASLREAVRRHSGYATWLSVDASTSDRPPSGDREVWTVPEDGGREPELMLVRWATAAEPALDRESIQTAARMVVSVARSARLFRFMAEQTSRDPLTDVLNRRGIHEVLERETRRADRGGTPLSVLFLDLDRFKEINDTHGHAVGDEVLCGVAQRLHRHLRRSDALGRLGGDEFLVVVPDADEDCAAQIAERLERLVADTPFPTSAGSLHVGLTAGAASADGASPEQAIRAADRRMLAGKRRPVAERSA